MRPSEQKKQVDLAEKVRKYDAFKLDPGLVKDPVKLREKKWPSVMATIGDDNGSDAANS